MLVASEMSGLNTLSTLARDSIEVGLFFLSRWRMSTYTAQFSMLDEDDKTRLLENFESRWMEFVDYVVSCQ